MRLLGSFFVANRALNMIYLIREQDAVMGVSAIPKNPPSIRYLMKKWKGWDLWIMS